MPQRIVLSNHSSIARALEALADMTRALMMSHKPKADQLYLIYDELMSITEDVNRLRMAAEADNMEEAQYEEMGMPAVHPPVKLMYDWERQPEQTQEERMALFKSVLAHPVDDLINAIRPPVMDDNIRVNMEPDKDADRENERGDQ